MFEIEVTRHTLYDQYLATQKFAYLLLCLFTTVIIFFKRLL
jgi:hypothetical protein